MEENKDNKEKELTPQQIKDSKALLGCEPPEKLQYDLTKEEKDSIKIDYRNANYKLIEINFPELISSPLILTKHSKELSDDFHGSKNILLSTFNSFFSFLL